MVRFTQPAEFNDPFELRPHIKGLADDATITTQHAIAFQNESIEDHARLAIEKLQLAPEQCSRINPSQVAKEISNRAGDVLELVRIISNGLGPAVSSQMNRIFNDNLGIFCLTEDPTNLLMWAHYADHHRGVVIEFDETHTFFNQRKGPQDDLRHFRKVNYTDVRPSVFLSLSDAIQVFYTKSCEWEYEREWRLITPLTDAAIQDENPGGPPIALFELPSEALVGVTTGCRIDHVMSFDLARLIRTNPAFQHVKFERVELDERRFDLHRLAVARDVIDAWLEKAMGLL
ncbi:MAG: hypothetical protein QOF24_3057 [Verrucomicrobiota bacterium]|jgi:DNA-directed RNA polymerase subunit H (RpoH/RPB5)